MSRIASTVVLTVVLLQAVGLSSAASIPCVEQCEDDGPDGQCAPTCEDCFCCAHPRAAFSRPASTLLPGALRMALAAPADAVPPETEIQEILRVPKPVA